MNYDLSNKKIYYSKELYEKLLPQLEDSFKKEYNIFLIGAKPNELEITMRQRFADLLKDKSKIKVHYPEYMFNDLFQRDQYDLLTLENILANSVDALVMCIESEGSIAELGAFSNNQAFYNKLIVYMNEKHARSDSFINLGPIKFLKNNTKSKVLWINYNDNLNEKIYFDLVKYLRAIKKQTTKNVNLLNPLIADKYLLILLYIFEELSWKEVVEIIKEIAVKDMKQENKVVQNIITIVDSTIGLMIFNKEVKKNNNIPTVYCLSEKGHDRIKQEFSPKFIHQYLDKLRLKVINLQYRKYWG